MKHILRVVQYNFSASLTAVRKIKQKGFYAVSSLNKVNMPPLFPYANTLRLVHFYTEAGACQWWNLISYIDEECVNS
jgi:hypothetical protein